MPLFLNPKFIFRIKKLTSFHWLTHNTTKTNCLIKPIKRWVKKFIYDT